MESGRRDVFKNEKLKRFDSAPAKAMCQAKATTAESVREAMVLADAEFVLKKNHRNVFGVVFSLFSFYTYILVF